MRRSQKHNRARDRSRPLRLRVARSWRTIGRTARCGLSGVRGASASSPIDRDKPLIIGFFSQPLASALEAPFAELLASVPVAPQVAQRRGPGLEVLRRQRGVATDKLG